MTKENKVSKSIERVSIVICPICKKERKLKNLVTKPYNHTCKSCGTKETYKNGRKPYHLKEHIKTEDLIREYISGKSSLEIAEEYDLCAANIIARLKKVGFSPRSYKEASILTMKKYNVLEKAHQKMNELRITGEWGKKISAGHQKISVKEWKKHKSIPNDLMRDAPEYQAWRKIVFEYDKYICVLCGQFGGVLEAHHIIPRKRCQELTLEVKNGVTLCTKCHKKKVTGHEESFIEYFLTIVDMRNKLFPISKAA